MVILLHNVIPHHHHQTILGDCEVEEMFTFCQSHSDDDLSTHSHHHLESVAHDHECENDHQETKERNSGLIHIAEAPCNCDLEQENHEHVCHFHTGIFSFDNNNFELLALPQTSFEQSYIEESEKYVIKDKLLYPVYTPLSVSLRAPPMC